MTKLLKQIFPLVLLLQILPGVVLAADAVRIREDAPGRYEVVRGDTLWDISGRFLEDPWLWPEVWELNPQIENPHLIYPGDVIELQYSADGPMLTIRRGGETAPNGIRTVRLSPQVRREQLSSAIPAIPLEEISPLLSKNLVLTESELDGAPYMLGSRKGNLFSSDTDEVFAKGSWDEDISQYDVVRSGRDYVDPDTGEVIGKEAVMIGSAILVKLEGDNATLRISDTFEEVRKGDFFIPGVSNRIDANYFPTPPSVSIEGSILDIADGKTIGNVFDTIVINRGERNRLQVGDLLALQKPDVELVDDVGGTTVGQQFQQALGLNNEHVESFSGEIYATVLVYRVFDNTSFGIILDADEVVRLRDNVITP